MSRERVSRRTFVAAAGTASTLLVAGCGDGGPGGGGEENDTGAEENDSMNESEDGGVGEEDNESAGEDNESANESEEETYTITITVEDQMGEPVDDAIVTVEGEGGILSGIFGGDEEEEAATDENGEVEAEGLENGEYTVTAEGNDGQTGEETVEVDGSDEEVTVTLGEDGEDNESDNDTGIGGDNESDNDTGIGEDDNDTGLGGDNESDNDTGLGGDNESDNDSGS